MSSEPYLFRLASRLTAGLADMQPERRERHRGFLLSQQMPDGGFRGREGDSDLYYTGFAVRGLALLDGLTPEVSDSIAGFLRSHQQANLSVIDLLSWLYSGLVIQLAGGDNLLQDAAADWDEQLAQSLEAVRTADGGYAKSTEGAAGSTYHSFLVALCYEMIGRDIPAPDRLIGFLDHRRRDDGGFVEIAPMKRSGTNPTAAAVALLNKFDAMNDAVREDVHDFLKDVRGDEGGFQANTRIPFSDGLSTFTGLLTAQDLGFPELLDADRARNFITDSLEFPTGGFRGAAWDDQADVEYTFYGLGVLGLLSP